MNPIIADAGPSTRSVSPVKRKRVTASLALPSIEDRIADKQRACDKCHEMSIKCTPGPTSQACQPCLSQRVLCTYDRPERRRGRVPQRHQGDNKLSIRSPQSAEGQSTTPSSTTAATVLPSLAWEYSPIAEDERIFALIDVFHDIAYPILIYFHWPTFWSNIHALRYRHDQHFHALTLAVCATAAARLRDGARSQMPSSPTLTSLFPVFYRASLDACRGLEEDQVTFDSMRAEAVLGMLCLQCNDVRGSHRHLHRYLGMAAEMGLHNEARWEQDLSRVEIEERRRLFWHQYHLDIQLSVTFGSSIRQRESQCNVAYPAEVFDDQDVLPDAVYIRPDRGISLIQGWNFVTDLYRILEHIHDRMRIQSRPDTDCIARIGFHAIGDNVQTHDILKQMADTYGNLPLEFKMPPDMVGNYQQDRYGFQAANIVITMTTVKMILAGSESDNIQQRCAVIGELLDGLATIPEAYIRAASTAMLHHLAGVGHLLASAIKSPLSPWGYLQARSVLLAIADLLAIFETSLTSKVPMSARIRKHVQMLDEHSRGSRGMGTHPFPQPGGRSRSNDPYPGGTTGSGLESFGTASRLTYPIRHSLTPQTSSEFPPASTVPVLSAPLAIDPEAEFNFASGNGATPLFDSLPLLPDNMLEEWPFTLLGPDGFDMNFTQLS